MGKTNAGWDKMQAITALILAIITIGSIVLSLGEAKNKLENLETGQKHITTELKEINLGLKSLYTTTYSKQDAEKDFAIRDRLWEAKYQALEKSQSQKSY